MFLTSTVSASDSSFTKVTRFILTDSSMPSGSIIFPLPLTFIVPGRFHFSFFYPASGSFSDSLYPLQVHHLQRFLFSLLFLLPLATQAHQRLQLLANDDNSLNFHLRIPSKVTGMGCQSSVDIFPGSHPTTNTENSGSLKLSLLIAQVRANLFLLFFFLKVLDSTS